MSSDDDKGGKQTTANMTRFTATTGSPPIQQQAPMRTSTYTVQVTYTIPSAISAPSYPANYLPGGIMQTYRTVAMPPVTVGGPVCTPQPQGSYMQAGYQMQPQNYPTQYGSYSVQGAGVQYSDQNLFFGQMTYQQQNIMHGTGQQIPVGRLPTPVSIQGFPAPQPLWTQRTSQQLAMQQHVRSQQQIQRFDFSNQLTNSQQAHLLSSDRVSRNQAVRSMPAIQSDSSRKKATQSARSMDKEGRDANITSQEFGSIIYGPQAPGTGSNVTIHEPQPEGTEKAAIILPNYPNKAFIVALPPPRMDVLKGWTQVNKCQEIEIQDLYYIVTGSEAPMPDVSAPAAMGTTTTADTCGSTPSTQPTLMPTHVTTSRLSAEPTVAPTSSVTASNLTTTTGASQPAATSAQDALLLQLKTKDDQIEHLTGLVMDLMKNKTDTDAAKRKEEAWKSSAPGNQ